MVPTEIVLCKTKITSINSSNIFTVGTLKKPLLYNYDEVIEKSIVEMYKQSISVIQMGEI